ncbi:glutamate/gamma-aminobutyrate family transporter YjeM [Tepidibacter aestuarii]|uniref:glutamate/gamma-aminobutyrate family transporter YjeM n=1 Tax=Tepidibacter aestuarii TaxID=2925782 RepID=UPI0020BF002F|nr:glutamate/gamma-aminobutyrate family transporter YjeM [Tepidibacter aestuarii]CAH2213083.1 putative transporter YjeM [Tepidibacter aestuarii]
MASNAKNTQKLTLISLILMIFTSVFGFNNIPRSFYLMGYGAIPWYILSAITFFIPYAFMMAEYGAAFKNEKGGIYSWMSISVGPKYAFIGTFMWYASYVIWMVNVASGIWVVFSNAIFGTDTTAGWSLFGLSATQTLGILAVVWMIFVTVVSSKGLDKIKKITSIGGTAVALLNVVLIIGGILVLIGNGGELAQPINNASAFVKSPNVAYSTPISVLSFLVFAIFAYGGIEAIGGLVDQTENAEKTFPKGVAISAIIIAVGYAIGIFFVGIFTNWNDILSTDAVHMGNVGYVVMNNLGYQLGQAFGVSQGISVQMGNWMARFVGISMLLALTGAFFTLTYSPLKQLIEGTPKELWPEKITETKDSMPVNAMWIQCVIVSVIILLVSFGGDTVSKFFVILVAMTNVAMTVPYMFVAGAFYSFKKKKEIAKPFEVYKSEKASLISMIVVIFTIGFANLFCIIQPAMNGDMITTAWSIAGPLVFSGAALAIYSRYEKNVKSKENKISA